MTTAAQHIRQAAAHEDAAGRHEGKAEEQLKAAGAEMYAAFTLAAKDAPELKGRKLDDKAIARLYQSTKPRPWWDDALAAGGYERGKATRQKAAYLMQWHLDIDAARARRASGRLQQAAAQKALRKQRATRARSMTSRSELSVTSREASTITTAAANSAHQQRELLSLETSTDVELGDLLGEVQRIQSSVRKVKPVYRGEVLSILKAAANDIERYIA